jgi:ATP-dependent helicase/nuclease subunit A
MKPTPRQQEAIEATGSVAVTAGAGTGKTAMLAARFVHHVVNDGFSPLQIAAVTFTEKAAAELRARIRSELTKAIGEELAAEVDAAQISTIHSLAARICRDFYGNLSPDFRLLDEIDSELFLAEWFDEILAKVNPETIATLGYSWVRQSLLELLSDPPAAESALELDENDYRQMIAESRDTALSELQSSDCWKTAEHILNSCSGSGDDKLEPHRGAVVRAMVDIANDCNIEQSVAAILATKINVGSKSNWPDGILQQVKDCIRSMRDAVGENGDFAGICLSWGETEQQMYQRVSLLREVFSSVRKQMQEAKRERGVADFADLEHYAIMILDDADARVHYGKRWKAILVDEFQDTNPEQEKLLKHLSETGARLTIVGDGKQSIYGFRRADPRVFERFRRSIDNDVVLDKTFRTHAGLVAPMNTIFEHLLGESHQPLDANRTELPHSGPFIEAHSFTDDDHDVGHMRRAEGRFIAAEIRRIIDEQVLVWDKKLHEHRPAQLSDIAIICRTRAPLETYIDELLEAGIPAVNTGGGVLLETRVAKDLCALLRFCSDPADDIALVALLRGPFFAVDDVTLYKLSLNRNKDETWWQLITRDHSTLERPYEILSRLLSATHSASAERLVQLAEEATGYTAVIKNLKQGDRRLADWFGFISMLRRLASVGRSDVVGADRYLKEIENVGASIPRPPLEAGNAISLMTIHAAKGLEWPVVFVPNLSASKKSDSGNLCFDAEMGVGFKFILRQPDGKFTKAEPAMLKLIRAKKRSDEQLEAARILYVAMTRARDRLYVTSAGKESGDFMSLTPGLEAAGVTVQSHDAGYAPEQPVVQPLTAAEVVNYADQLSSVAPYFDVVPVTGLVEYSICPKRFKYQYVDGHPGVGEGSSSNAREIGTLTHTALELDMDTSDGLSPFSDGASDETLNEALRLANVFRSDAVFSSFHLGNFRREVSVHFELDGIMLSGKADLVGDDYVLDFKTDSEPVPVDHAVQLWAYATALDKPKAYIAYLRQQKLHEYTIDELSHAQNAAKTAVAGIASGNFVSTPTESSCLRCAYCVICDERHKS